MLPRDLPEEWLRKLAEKLLTPEEMAQIEALGGFEKLMETLQAASGGAEGAAPGRHRNGSAPPAPRRSAPYGYNPEGVRIGQDESRHRRAVKVWDKREFRDLDDTIELGTRNMKLALRRLRRFARQGAATELDLPDTIRATANNAGTLDLKMVPERHNAVKVLLFLDIGGSMDDHVKRTRPNCSRRARSEFKHLEYFYFHNCPYERRVEEQPAPARCERIPTFEVMRTYGPDYKLIFVGDAAMSPYEITMPGGSVEHWNEEAGAVWMRAADRRITAARLAQPERRSAAGGMRSRSVCCASLMEGRMYPLTLEGLDAMTRELSR